MTTPHWVSKDLIQTALRSYFGNQELAVMGYSSSAAVPVGDNYTSDIFRTVVTFQTDTSGNRGTISMIMKCSPVEKKEMLELTRQEQYFAKEIEVYKTTLPAIYDTLGEYFTLSAKFIYYTEKPHTLLMFEDLGKLGFQMHNRQTGFDLNHCLLVAEKIACLHAASLVLHEKHPGLYKAFDRGIFSKNEMITVWITRAFESLIKACSTWPGYEKYSKKLQAILDRVVDRAIWCSSPKLGSFKVLNHGDAWVNNFLFSYDSEGKLKDCKFVDYQLVIFSSPAIDLHYFWTTSPKMEVRREHLDTILDRYYSKLLYTLASLNYSLERIPTKKQFLKDWKSRSFYGLLAAAAILPLVKASSRNDASFEDLMADDSEDSFRYHAYNNERYRKHMEYLLPFFDDLGALDYF
ncbi:hypothetical protein PPYR_02553 [Photinus pyralis]|uniref:CHK kinase-like domain-containing protein n=1 Tax=Photinus pyralis TaxID=7054 RepID=A0A5N4B7S0_PHOPY|nr:uncharacterized protein LOC116166127 [Photinus pyralis]KAB0805583.1 hypothetical protein PPYR_02553 [Photinus pyralis]